MPKETFGGDDDSAGAAPEEKKRKLDLSRYLRGQDMNIRDAFWEIMSAYASGKPPAGDLPLLGNDRLSLVRAAIGAIGRPSPMHGRLTPNLISRYTLMMLLDAGWQDAFAEFLEECDHRDEQRKTLAAGMKKLAEDKAYAGPFAGTLRQLLRGREGSGSALRYVALVSSGALAAELKKELVIFARGDIGENQLNAIASLALLPEDEDVQKTMIMLLSHWDEMARKCAAEFLLKHRSDAAAQAAGKRIGLETDQEIKKMLEKLAKGKG